MADSRGVYGFFYHRFIRRRFIDGNTFIFGCETVYREISRIFTLINLSVDYKKNDAKKIYQQKKIYISKKKKWQTF